MSPRPVLLVAIASLLLTSADASAQEAYAGPQGRWYGYQTLIFDGAAAVLFPVGLAVAFEEGGKSFPIKGFSLMALGGSAYLFGPPTVHWVHGRVGVGFLSMGLRLLSPVAGLGLGAIASEIATRSKNQIGIPIGVVVGAVAAAGVDAAVLAWDKGPRGVSSPYTVLPDLVITRRAATIGVAGAF
jgi:hypothetical protein